MATANIYDLADTWNDGLTTFTAIKMDVTDTASASGSLLMDLQVGSSSKFSFKKDGTGIATVWQASALSATGNGVYLTSTGGVVQFSSDAFISRKGAANLRLGNADAATPVAQTLSVQSVSTGTTNTAGQDFTIQGSAGTGSGAGGSIIFQVAPASGSGTGQNTLVDALTIGSDRRITMNAPSDFNPMLKFESNVGLGSYLNNSFFVRLDNTTPIYAYRSGAEYRLAIGANYYLGFLGPAQGATSEPDTKIYRDAANTLALRNGANAQTFNIYNTYTNATDYERGFLKWNSNVLEIGTEAGASGGTDRETRFVQGGSAAISIKSSQVEVSRLLIPSSTGGTSLGAATKQWNNFYASGAIYLTGLPASDPVSAGQLWNDSGTLKVSAG